MAMVRGDGDKKKQEKEVKQLKEDKELLEVAVATGAVSGGTGVDEQAHKLQALILERLEKRQSEEDAEREKVEARVKQRILQVGQEAERKNRAIAQLQASCSHLDDHGKKRTGGQWNSDGHYNAFCLYCFKKWSNRQGGEACPPHLWPSEMGGAVMENVNRVGAAA